MASRIELQLKLEEMLGSRNVYFQPPASIRLKYPAIVYSLSRLQPRHADNIKYKVDRSYDITLIDPDPDSQFVDKILEFPYCSFDRSFQSDNLNHFTFTIYY